jgi:hypothetical protein
MGLNPYESPQPCDDEASVAAADSSGSECRNCSYSILVGLFIGPAAIFFVVYRGVFVRQNPNVLDLACFAFLIWLWLIFLGFLIGAILPFHLAKAFPIPR